MQIIPASGASDVISITTALSHPLELRISEGQGSRIAWLTIGQARQLAYAILLEAEQRAATSN